MKTRQGFVSNSSSSSFVVIVTVPAFREALTRMKETRDAKVVHAVATNEKVFGIPAKLIKEFTDMGGHSSIWGDGESEILEKAGIVYPPVDENGDEIDPPEGEEWCPTEAIFEYTQILEEMAKEKDWKDQIFQCDVCDG